MSYRELDVKERIARLEERVSELEFRDPKSNLDSILDKVLDKVLDEADSRLLFQLRFDMSKTNDHAFLVIYRNKIEDLVKQIKERNQKR